LYQVEVKTLNRAVKRNIKRFPDDFMFQLSNEEWEGLKRKIDAYKIQSVCFFRTGDCHAFGALK